MGSKKIVFDKGDSFVAYSLPGEKQYTLLYSLGRDNGHLPSYKKHPFCFSTFLKEKSIVFFEHAETDRPFDFHPSDLSDVSVMGRDHYLSAVDNIIRDINDHQYDKLVYSRLKKVRRHDVGIQDLFVSLIEAHPAAFVFCYFIPGRGCWMGATPELLVKEDDGKYKTMALAGTQLDLGLPLDEVLWGDKEKAEQQFIVDFVSSELKKRGAAFKVSPDRTIRAGEVLHICTDISIEQGDYNITDIAEYLHPSPAISGVPQDVALEKIKTSERHERQDYCGYLGPLGADPSLYVNLRSMRIYRDAYVLFLGGGITAKSVAEQEWQETEDKSKTLMSLIEKSYIS